jgi:hypothetical protein
LAGDPGCAGDRRARLAGLRGVDDPLPQLLACFVDGALARPERFGGTADKL